jgi:hypothetical protein
VARLTDLVDTSALTKSLSSLACIDEARPLPSRPVVLSRRSPLLRPPPTAARPPDHFPGSPVIGGHRFPPPRRRRGRDGSPQFQDDHPHVRRPIRRRIPRRPLLDPRRLPWPSPCMNRLGTLSPAPRRDRMTTLTRASLTLPTPRSPSPRFAPGLSTTHGAVTTGDPAVSPHRTHTGRPLRTCRSINVMTNSLSSWRPSSLGALAHCDSAAGRPRAAGPIPRRRRCGVWAPVVAQLGSSENLLPPLTPRRPSSMYRRSSSRGPSGSQGGPPPGAPRRRARRRGRRDPSVGTAGRPDA